MALPFFYSRSAGPVGSLVILDESTSKHITQVLRMKEGEKLHLTDGKGKKLVAVIGRHNKKECTVFIEEEIVTTAFANKVTIAISPVKNTARFEWFLEKSTEIGICSVVPLICERTERAHFRGERLKNIMVSAMLQSQQTWLPDLSDPMSFEAFISMQATGSKYIAHCLEDQKQTLRNEGALSQDSIICIGPEGDFTKAEIDKALQQGYIPVSIGETRLRTETAGIAAAVLLRIK